MTEGTPPDAPRPIERDGRTWIRRPEGGWAWWDPARADWVDSAFEPSPGPETFGTPGPAAEPYPDPWKETSVLEDADEYFTRGPGKNLLIATGIFLGAMLALWGLAEVWDPFGVRDKGVFKAFSDALPFLAVIVAVPWFIVNGIQRVRRGEPFVPPRVRAAVSGGKLESFLWRQARLVSTTFAVLLFLSWWLLGYLKPFGVSPIEFGPWENNPYLLVAWIVCAAIAAAVWIASWSRRPR